MLARIGDDELTRLLEGYGHRPIFVVGDDPPDVHQQLAAALDEAFDEIALHTTKGPCAVAIAHVRSWPMIVLRTPKGWTCPKEVDGVPIEGTFRAHQVPVGDGAHEPGALEGAR